MIAAYSLKARGRSERMFRTHQERLPRELLLAGITDMAQANHYLKNVYLPAFNADSCSRLEKRATLVLWIGGDLDDILCEASSVPWAMITVCALTTSCWQIPPDCYRCHYVGAKVRVNRYSDGHLAVLHGPHKLAEYDSIGQLLKPEIKTVAKVRRHRHRREKPQTQDFLHRTKADWRP
jgi:hypothetical protein